MPRVCRPWRAGAVPAEHCRRDIVDGIRYLVKEGIQWRAMPAAFPPYQTIYDITAGWQASGATEATHGELRDQCRAAAGRRPWPAAAVIDSQSVRGSGMIARTCRRTAERIIRTARALAGTRPSGPHVSVPVKGCDWASR